MSDYTRAFQYCKAHENDIAAAMRNGDTDAAAIIVAYRMILRAPEDAGGVAMFIEAVEGYQALRELDGEDAATPDAG